MENITKRMKNAIVQEFVFHSVVAILFVLSILFYIVPTQAEIQQKISLLEELNTNLSIVQSSGISFEDFYEAASTDSQSSPYMKTLLTQLDTSFFDTNFKNTNTSLSYQASLEKKKQSVETQKKSQAFISKQNTISDILPTYTSLSQKGNKNLSDFEFINNLEELLFSFNLSSNDPIGIGNVEIVSSQKNLGTPTEIPQGVNIVSSETNIYSFPIDLDLVGQKKDILDFLHYLENVGNIELRDGNLITYTDKVLPQFSSELYKNQFVDIKSLTMKSYIDTSSSKVDGDFITFIKSTQAGDRFDIKLTLRFYALGLPKYKVESEISEIMKQSRDLQARMTKSIKKYQEISTKTLNGDVIVSINQIKSLSFLMAPLIKDISVLTGELSANTQDMDILYKKLQDFKNKIYKIDTYYTKQIDLLETIK